MDQSSQNALNTGETEANGVDPISGQVVQQAEGETKSSGIVLDTLDQFEFQGHKYTPEELSRAILRQADYTRKTQEIAQERKNLESQFGENSKYILNYRADLQRVRENPSMASEFKKLYPEEFHYLVDRLTGEDEDDDVEADELDQRQSTKMPKEVKNLLNELRRVKSELEGYKNEFQTREESAADKYLDVVFGKLSQKYPFAVEDSVINAAQKLIDENEGNPRFKMTDAVWERLFKQVNEQLSKRFEKQYNSQVANQVRKSERASDSAPGGMAPGRPGASGPKTFAEATEMMIQDLRAQGAR